MAPSVAPWQAGLVRRFAHVAHSSTPTGAALAALKWLLGTPPRPVMALVPLRVHRTTRRR